MILPEKTVQRLSKYRSLLNKYKYLQEPFIYSHDLARLLNLNPVQVRRDLMLIGSSGNNRKGYNVLELIDMITDVISLQESKYIAIIGFGRLGQAICSYMADMERFQEVVAAFDVDPSKINKSFNRVNCYDISRIHEIVTKKNIRVAVLSIPDDNAGQTTDILIKSGIKGILNFTSVKLSVPESVYVKDFDIITSLEEIGYFSARKK